jgi:hypothetical protein
MKYAYLMRSAVIAATLGAGCVFAQTATTGTDAGPGKTVTDVGPPPAEERNSAGAIVLENSLVRAQREDAFQKSSTRTGVASVGRGVLRATMNAKAQADLAQAREDEAVKLHGRGAGSLTPK